MSEMQLTYQQFYIYIVIGGAILGALFGLIPLLVGRKRGRARLGVYGFIASIVGGAIAALLGLIVAGIFLWLVVRETPAQAGTSADPSNADRDNNSSD